MPKVFRVKRGGHLRGLPLKEVEALVDLFVDNDEDPSILPIEPANFRRVEDALDHLRSSVLQHREMARKVPLLEQQARESNEVAQKQEAELRQIRAQLEQAQRQLDEIKAKAERRREDANEVQRSLLNGVEMLKFCRKSAPHRKIFHLEDQRAALRLSWNDGKRFLVINEVIAILRGRCTPELLKGASAEQENCCFAIFTPAYTLSLQADSPRSCDLWVAWLTARAPSAAVSLERLH